jgi:hypothetical protein
MPRTAALLAVLASISLPSVAATQVAAGDTVVAAVQRVNPRTRTIDLTSGVGLALRVVRLQVPAETLITAGGQPLRFDLIVPGDVLRVSFGARQTGYVAYTIERIGHMSTGQEPTP